MRSFKQAMLAAVVCTGTLLAAHPAFCYSLDFTMVDNTNQPVVAMWTSLSSSDEWLSTSNAYVGQSGGSQKITFAGGASGQGCYYDVKVEFSGGDVRVLSGIDLCQINTIELNVNDAGNVTYQTFS